MDDSFETKHELLNLKMSDNNEQKMNSWNEDEDDSLI